MRAAIVRLSMFGLLMNQAAPLSAAPLANSDNSDFYYEIGGARSISVPANTQVNSYAINGALEYGLGYSCGNFDPTLGVANLLNGLQQTGNNLVNGAVGAVQAAIGGLPALVLQRIDPGLYDLFQNAVIRAEAAIALANKTCEDYEQEIRQGQNPYADWSDLSKIIDWKVQMGKNGYGSAKVDVVQAKQNVQKANGQNGIPWIGGKKAGGVQQAAIQVTQDSVQAGYNLTLNRQAGDNSAPKVSKSKPPRLVEVFADPGKASQWAVDVLGDVHIRTHDNHPVETIPGHGLLPKVEKDMASIQQGLTDLVSGKTQASLTNLEKVSSDAVLINGDVIAAIKSLKPSEQAVAISKLASEAAMTRTVEKAMLIRRLLLTASREPNLSATQANTAIQTSITQLDRDINDVLFERQIYNELASKTSGLLLSLQQQQTQRGRTALRPAGADDSIFQEGAIKP
ncbi:integrating conjugative element protein [Methylomonas lenta]|nr:integrating conjugative element protein [Methylomonas lenta]